MAIKGTSILHSVIYYKKNNKKKEGIISYMQYNL